MPENDPRPLLPLWVAVLAAVAGGLVYDLGFPGAGVWPLAFAGIALALVSLIGRSAWSAALVGFAFGLAFYLQLVSWTSLYLGPIPWLALSIFESFFVAGGARILEKIEHAGCDVFRRRPVLGPLDWPLMLLRSLR